LKIGYVNISGRSHYLTQTNSKQSHINGQYCMVTQSKQFNEHITYI